MWRIFTFPLYDQSHAIIRLPIHLPNGQQVYFRDGAEDAALDRAENNDTLLTAWFDLNRRDAHYI